MTVAPDAVPISILDFVGIEHGQSASAPIAEAVSVARAVDEASTNSGVKRWTHR